MKPADYYRGREQTYLKHFFLEKYLERVAYNIGWSHLEFVYVDGFSGPWKSQDEALGDTSFMIAIKKLRSVREILARQGKHPRIRCLFIEKDIDAYRTLKTAVEDVGDIQIQTLNSEFEDAIPEIIRFVGNAFSLVFIDPTGWTGFGLKQIAPILRHQPGEVLVNFMFDHINRFLEDERPDIAASFAELFGGADWEAALQTGARRESAVVEIYRDRLRDAGGFKYVTSTRILKPLHDRSYFYLVYGTRHPKGLIEFRGVEKKAVNEQELVRRTAKQEKRQTRTGQAELFTAAESVPGTAATFDDERATQQRSAETLLRKILARGKRVEYDDALATLLELPLVWESDVKRIILGLRDAGEIDIVGLRPPGRVPKQGHILARKA